MVLQYLCHNLWSINFSTFLSVLSFCWSLVLVPHDLKPLHINCLLPFEFGAQSTKCKHCQSLLTNRELSISNTSQPNPFGKVKDSQRKLNLTINNCAMISTKSFSDDIMALWYPINSIRHLPELRTETFEELPQCSSQKWIQTIFKRYPLQKVFALLLLYHPSTVRAITFLKFHAFFWWRPCYLFSSFSLFCRVCGPQWLQKTLTHQTLQNFHCFRIFPHSDQFLILGFY